MKFAVWKELPLRGMQSFETRPEDEGVVALTAAAKALFDNLAYFAGNDIRLTDDSARQAEIKQLDPSQRWDTGISAVPGIGQFCIVRPSMFGITEVSLMHVTDSLIRRRGPLHHCPTETAWEARRAFADQQLDDALIVMTKPLNDNGFCGLFTLENNDGYLEIGYAEGDDGAAWGVNLHPDTQLLYMIISEPPTHFGSY